MDRYLFLDFDGVLNTGNYARQMKREGIDPFDEYGAMFDPEAIANMKRLCVWLAILIAYATESNQEFDELLIEKNRYGAIWVHFAVRPKDNRHKALFINA